ncbi:MAG TPA: envelope stress response membrane protein PspB [Gammaproteobacteria bacterium]|jgi:phage shock protein B
MGGDQIFVLTILFMVIVFPLMVIMHYSTKWKATKGLTDEEQKTLEALWQDSMRMDSRLNALETILDDEIPDWRKKL